MITEPAPETPEQSAQQPAMQTGKYEGTKLTNGIAAGNTSRSSKLHRLWQPNARIIAVAVSSA